MAGVDHRAGSGLCTAWRQRAVVAVVAATVALAVAACAGGSDDTTAPTTAVRVPPPLRLNQLQVIGTHNSYHLEAPPEQLEARVAVDPGAIELAYSHLPIPEQLSTQGVRQLELDVFADPDGSLWDPVGTPGFKVFHEEQADPGTTCPTLVGCLTQVRDWSDAHPGHLPIAVLVELKDGVEVPGPPDPVPFTAELTRALDAEIRSVFPEERLLTPDDVRGDAPTLEAAVLAGGWPLVDDVRDRVLFLLDNKRELYVEGNPNLEGRVLFTPAEPGQPDAAFVKRNQPTGANREAIAELVRRGYLVRTRADIPVATPVSGDTSRREAALASGAQFVSTDYPVAGMAERWGSDYVAAVPGGAPARCNPVNAPPGCLPTDLEDLGLAFLPWPADRPLPSLPVPPLPPGAELR